jgi:glycosyltransferase involved in cell wall biosynthesis
MLVQSPRQDSDRLVEGPGPAVVGVAIPAYNAAETLEATLRSCIAQSWSHWFAVVTVDGDDASKELEIASRLQDSRIRVESNGGRVGQFGNFNRALLRCYGAGAKWIKFLCADDMLEPDALERMLWVGGSTPNCGLVYGYYNGIDGRDEVISRVDLSKVATRTVGGREFLVRSFRESEFNVIGGPSSVMIRADTIERCGIFDDRLNYSGEALLWYRILSRFDIGIVGERPILQYRFHENSVTGRGSTTVARFEQPMDIARDIGAQYPPSSREWKASEWIKGEVAASNLITAAALLRRGQVRIAFEGALASVRRVTWRAGVSVLYHLPVKASRLVRGRPLHKSTELCPPVEMLHSRPK